ncbi:hypothetical protein cypCar_00046110, partial [Cyprinus carpio]
MSDCEPLSKRRRLPDSQSLHHRTEDAEKTQKPAPPCSDHPEGSAKLQKNRAMSSGTLDSWLLKSSPHHHHHHHTEPEDSRKQKCPESTLTSEKSSVTEPRRTGSALVSDAAANTGKITNFFTEAPGKGACRRAAAAAGADGKAFSGDVTGLGVPVGDLRRAPACSGPLPALKPTDSHTVLIRTDLLRPGEVPEPYPSPHQLQDRWDDTHVKLPCSEHNLFPADRT